MGNVVLLIPVHLALLHDHLVGLLPHDAAVEPQLGPVDNCSHTQQRRHFVSAYIKY